MMATSQLEPFFLIAYTKDKSESYDKNFKLRDSTVRTTPLSLQLSRPEKKTTRTSR